MAQLETWYKQDLKKPLVVHKHADVFNQDSRGNLIGVEVYIDGEPVTLTGSISGYCLLADGTTVPAVGASRSGNKASVLIPQTAYNVPGVITVTIKNVDGNDITTLCAVVGLVRQSVSGNLVNPGSVVTDWSNSINAQLQAVQDAADNVGAIVAAPFAKNTVYVAGNYVTNNGNLYRITGDHAAGVTWANTQKVQCTVGTELYDLKAAFNQINTDALKIASENLLNADDFTDASDVSYAVDTSTGKITITTTTAVRYACLQTPATYVQNNLQIGKKYRLHIKADSINGATTIVIAVRGVKNNVGGVAKLLTLSSGLDGYIDFVADQYMRRITVFMSFGKSALNSVAVIGDIWLERVADSLAITAQSEKSLNAIGYALNENNVFDGVYDANAAIVQIDGWKCTKPVYTGKNIPIQIILNDGYGLIICNTEYSGGTLAHVRNVVTVTETGEYYCPSDYTVFKIFKGNASTDTYQAYTDVELFENVLIHIGGDAESETIQTIIGLPVKTFPGRAINNIGRIFTLANYALSVYKLDADVDYQLLSNIPASQLSYGIDADMIDNVNVNVDTIGNALEITASSNIRYLYFNTTIDGINYDVTVVPSYMAENRILGEKKIRRMNPYTWENKGYYSATGESTSDPTVISASVDNTLTYITTLHKNYEFGLLAFDGSTYIGWYDDGIYKEGVDRWRSEVFIPADGYNHIIIARYKADITQNVSPTVANTFEYEFTIPVTRKLVVDLDGNTYALDENQPPDSSDVIWFLGDNYVKKDGNVLYYSIDGGETYHAHIDISSINGIIKNVYVYEDGTLALFTADKAYYSDWGNILREATVYEEDGTTIFTPTGPDQFTVPLRIQYRRIKINGTEFYFFGNYSYERNVRICLFYSNDSGRTYHVLYEFNLENTLNIRHIHDTVYCPYDGSVWVTTGDDPGERHVCKFTWDATNNKWLYSLVGSGGIEWKWCSLVFEGGKGYFCQDGTPGKVYCFNYENSDDPTKFVKILDNLPNDPIMLVVGPRGDVLVTCSWYRTSGTSPSPDPYTHDAKKLYYAKDGYNFVEIMGPFVEGRTDVRWACYMGVCGPNSSGKVLAHMSEADRTTLSMEGKTVFLDAVIRKAGYPGAFLR